MKSTGCVPHHPPGPKGSIWGVRNACQSRRKKTCKSIEFEPQKQHLVRNAKRGILVFPRELSHWALRSPPRDPLTYMQIYDVLAHLGLRNHVFYRPDQNRALPQPPGAPGRPPAPPGGPPGIPPGPGRNRTEKTRHFGLPGWPEARVLRPPSKPESQSDRENAALCTARSKRTPKIPRKYRRLPQKTALPHASRAPRKKK